MSTQPVLAVERVLLRPEPASPAAARRFVRAFCARQAVPDTVDERLELIACELVTNAVLHAGTPLTLSLERGADRVRVSVHDRSPALPAMRHYQPDALTGHGLGLVAGASDSWGVDRAGTGKTVWAEVGLSSRGRDQLAAAPSGASQAERAGLPAGAAGEGEIRYVGVPVQAYLELQEHNDALLRELELICIGPQTTDGSGHAAEPPRLVWLAEQLAWQFRGARDRQRAVVAAAAARGEHTVELISGASPGLLGAARAYVELLEEADGFCRSGALLTPPPSLRVTALRRWFVDELAAQLEGAEPTPFPGA